MILFNNLNVEVENDSQVVRKIMNVILGYIKPKENLIVALLLKRSPLLLWLIKELFDNGVTFLLIDIDLPMERIEYMIHDSKANLIISQLSSLSITNCKALLNIDDIIIYRDMDDGMAHTINITDIAYILYTSGSTGKPKGVMVLKKSVLNFADSIIEILKLSTQNRVACLTTVSFDVFFLESLVPLIKGLSIALANKEEQYNPKRLQEFIISSEVDVIQMTPSKMQMLINFDQELRCLNNIRIIILGGEKVPLTLLRTLQKKTSAEIYNMYGPTETTIYSTVSNLTYKEYVDIGFPIKNTSIYIVNKKLHVLKMGEIGEICIAGIGVAEGYINQEDLTKEKFVYLPEYIGTRAFRTGDIGKISTDGSLYYLGRNDNQVKLRGYRIELEEIESYINQIVGIKQCLALLKETSNDDKILEVLYTSDDEYDYKYFVEYLSQKIPAYMIPTKYKRVNNFILTTNGKIDRKIVVEKENQVDHPEIITDNIEDKIMSIIDISVDDKVNDSITIDTEIERIGIDSISFIKLVISLENEFSFEFDDDKLLISAFTTVGDLIEYIKLKRNI